MGLLSSRIFCPPDKPTIVFLPLSGGQKPDFMRFYCGILVSILLAIKLREIRNPTAGGRQKHDAQIRATRESKVGSTESFLSGRSGSDESNTETHFDDAAHECSLH